jgi:hypothetical protein
VTLIVVISLLLLGLSRVSRIFLIVGGQADRENELRRPINQSDASYVSHEILFRIPRCFRGISWRLHGAFTAAASDESQYDPGLTFNQTK